MQRTLERNRFYIKLRYSKWVYAFWLLLRPDVKKEVAAKKKFYQSVIPANCKLIFDIGANEGITTEIFKSISQDVVAIEPSERNINILSVKFGNNKNITIVSKAVSEKTGQQLWYEDENNYAMGTLSSKWNHSKPGFAKSTPAYVSTITLDDLIKQFETPGFIKIDVEGNEWQALKGLSQPVPLLSFEAILPQFKEETISCIEYIVGLKSSALFNYVAENVFVYESYQQANILLNDIATIHQTIDIFCKI